MSKGFHKKQSKRMLAKRRYKIEKKVRDHKKKLKKQEKLHKHKKSPKDPGIPNSLPFKDKVIKEFRGAMKKEKNSRNELREQMKKIRQNGKEKEFLLSRGIYGKGDRFFLLKKQIEDAAKVNGQSLDIIPSEVDLESDDVKASTSGSSVSNLKNYHKEFQKVIEGSDVLIEVLDARDPLGTRCPDVEKALVSSDKRLILLLNKVDLVPRDNLVAWLGYLRKEFPTLPFKASTQKQKNHLARAKRSVMQTTEALLSSSKECGAKDLISLLKNYCRSEGIKKSITVGVVGLPNVGKSSVINTLKCTKVCNVGAVPGITKVAQKVVLDKNIELLDCPGIVYASEKHFKDVIDNNKTLASVLALRNCIPFEQLDDPVQPIEAILSRIKKENLMILYKLPDFTDSSDFLAKVARRFGYLRKGGIVDIESAAKKVINDWNNGTINYVTEPPEKYEMSSYVSAEIVTKMSKGFDIGSLENEDDEMEEEMDEESGDEDQDDDDEGADSDASLVTDSDS